MKYTKKQITVEALQWDGQNHRAMFEFLGGNKDEFLGPSNENFYIDHSKVERGLIIKTSEGNMAAHVGDYIVKEPFDKERKYYPVKAHIFEQTYHQGENPLNELKKIQNHYGCSYKESSEISPIVLLGLMGTVAELLKSTDIKHPDIDNAINTSMMIEHIRNLILLGKSDMPIVHVENNTNFNEQLSVLFYDINILAINRGLSLEDLAKLCIEKIKDEEEASNKKEVLG